MYRITADGVLIYDSTLDDYKIGKGQVTLEADKSGSFVFSLYPDHPNYDTMVALKTVITVYKDKRIVFRGRVLNETTDYWNNKVITCEGELGFLQDSIVRPFTFAGDPATLFRRLIETHNAQVDEFKRFKVGKVEVVDSNEYIARENSAYETTLSNLNSRLLDSGTGGHFYITHDGGTDPTPTIHYLADFPETSSQAIEFGVNLRNYTKTLKAEELATAIIPLGATADDGNSETEDQRLTIESVNGGVDYVYSRKGVALFGWIFKVVEWDDVTEPLILKRKAEAAVDVMARQNVTIELGATDMHLFDRSIESYGVCQYIPVSSQPHGFAATMLCNKQTLDLLTPSNDSVVLGYTYATFTEANSKRLASSAAGVVALKSTIQKTVSATSTKMNEMDGRVQKVETFAANMGLVNITKTGNKYTADRTLDSVRAAVAAGGYLAARLDGEHFCPLVYVDATEAQFHGHAILTTGERHYYVSLYDDGADTVVVKEIQS